jgi:hypothetical protein
MEVMASDMKLTNANGRTLTISNVDTETTDVTVSSSDMKDLAKRLPTAWITLDGTATSPMTIASGGILDAYNISSVNRVSAGVYDFTFETAMDNANYCVTASSDYHGIGDVELPSTTGFRVANISTSATYHDTLKVYVQIFGGKN